MFPEYEINGTFGLHVNRRTPQYAGTEFIVEIESANVISYVSGGLEIR